MQTQNDFTRSCTSSSSQSLRNIRNDGLAALKLIICYLLFTRRVCVYVLFDTQCTLSGITGKSNAPAKKPSLSSRRRGAAGCVRCQSVDGRGKGVVMYLIRASATLLLHGRHCARYTVGVCARLQNTYYYTDQPNSSTARTVGRVVVHKKAQASARTAVTRPRHTASTVAAHLAHIH
jgi:hypothetical protein